MHIASKSRTLLFAGTISPFPLSHRYAGQRYTYRNKKLSSLVVFLSFFVSESIIKKAGISFTLVLPAQGNDQEPISDITRQNIRPLCLGASDACFSDIIFFGRFYELRNKLFRHSCLIYVCCLIE